MNTFLDMLVKCFITEDRYMLYVKGIGITIIVSLFGLILGLILGFITVFFNLSKNKVLNKIGAVYVDVIRGTPSVTQLMIIYFVIFGKVYWPKWIIAGIAFGINSGAYIAEILRAGILSIDKGQTEAGRSLGLTQFQTMKLIILPQALKNVFPALCNEFIVLVKETAIVGYVGLMDLQKAGDFIKSATFLPFVPLISVAFFYYILIKLLTIGLKLIENNLRASDVR